MIHKTRRYSISEVPTLGELATTLVDYDWTLCSGFLSQGLLLVNDAFSEDGAQEYVVFRCPYPLADLLAGTAPELEQIESLTCSWMKAPELAALLPMLAGLPGPAMPPSEDPAGIVVASTVAVLAAAMGAPPPSVMARVKIRTHGKADYCQRCA